MRITSPQHDRLDAVAATPGPTPAAALEFWKAKLGGDLPVLDLPVDRPRPRTADPVPTASGNARRAAPVRIGSRVVLAQRLLARAEETTPFVVAVAGFKVFLARMARQRDIIVGTARPLPVALRTALPGDPTFREVIRRVRDTVREADAHGGVSLDQVVAELPAPLTPGVRSPVQASFHYRQSGAGDRSSGAFGPTQLSLLLREDGNELSGQIEGPAELFDQSTVNRFAAIVEHLVERSAAEPDTSVFALPLLPPSERARILQRLNRYERPDITYTTMAQPLEEQVGRTPDLDAVVADGASLTYAELNARANRLAWFLRRAGARPGTSVAVSMERGLDLMVALYAVVKSGAAYVPVDPELPDARMAFMLEDSTPIAVLVDRATRPRLPSGPWRVLAVEEDPAPWAAESTRNLPPLPGNHLIHLLYTSGTTGRPKAVAYPVEGALADIFWMQERYPYRTGDTAILKTSYGFDVSIWEIFWPLYRGARVAICPPGAHRDPVRLRDCIDRHQVTAMFMVPTMMQPFYDHTPPGSCRSLRHVFCGGEPVTPRVRDGFHARFGADLVNCYGPTELGCVAETILPAERDAPVVVGPPPAHRRTYVLDDNLEPTPIGVAGELFVGGDVGIAQGYHRRPGLTAERFLADPYGAAGRRMYRTGDLCRYREDGALEHLGRIGRQVKIRGMRLELAEIEAVFAEHEDVGRCVVTVVPDRDGEIAAFVVPADARSIAIPALLAHAAALLPTAALPATVTVVDRIPTFVNEKIDFGALLRRIDRSVDHDPLPVVAPANHGEAAVARIYCEILGRDVVSVTESFFALGGHSLLVFKLIELCADAFGVALSVDDVLEALSPRELATVIARRHASGNRT